MTSWSSFVGMANVGWSLFNWKSIEFCILYSAHLILLISLHCICSIKGQFCKTWGQIFYLEDTLKTKYTGKWLHTKLCEIILWDIYTETRKMSGKSGNYHQNKIQFSAKSGPVLQAPDWRRFLSLIALSMPMGSDGTSVIISWVYNILYSYSCMGSSQSGSRYGMEISRHGSRWRRGVKIIPKYFLENISNYLIFKFISHL